MSPVALLQSRYDPSQYDANHSSKTSSGAVTVSKENQEAAQYPQFLPTWNPNVKLPTPKPFNHFDKGVLGSDSHKDLLVGDYKLRKITPKFGTEVDGIQLSSLNEAGKNDLGKLIAERGVVIFRNQDWAKFGPQFLVDFTQYYGPLHQHPTSGTPENFPQIHVSFVGQTKKQISNIFATRTNNIQWHSDVSYELQPPHYTFFSVLQGPESGGDTLFADTVEAYNRLSPTMQKMIANLHVLHTSEDQAKNNQSQGGVLRRDPISNIHPLVRQHPVTKQKYLYLNREFGRKIVELKQEESDNLLHFLYNHVESSLDLQLRANWEPNTVVMWDNRRTVHTPVMDWDPQSPLIRHAVRLSPQGERPVENLLELNQ
jgi:sulfonate dioxygenase